MSESWMLAAVNAALTGRGIDDRVTAAGRFSPRGASGGMFAGGLAGDTVGGLVGGVADAVGTVGGALAGQRAAGRARGLPARLLVAVSTGWVYGFDGGRSGSREAGELVFRFPRAGLTVTVGQRVNVRTVTLAAADGSRVELEGHRLPVTHSKDVIDVLRAPA